MARLAVMLLTDAPTLLYVIGLPAGLLLCGLVVGGAAFMLLGRSRRS
ncbi:MAG: hypothetical protein JF886_09175 [Candidatus Dormibacteraeota bacterium]|uniref:Uncharacterized protein n=1 Tax=Candidatus Aeolococcus gillhamiae TaxID=3127015 RepID=A0A934K3N4_9BACT|nr:hypothetical protein [Candidatus Dormibacteraeota bacterium]